MAPGPSVLLHWPTTPDPSSLFRDYTLIGEELYAASAYISRDPQQLGSLKGHDFGKLLVILLVLSGVVMEIIGAGWFKKFFEGGN